VDRSGIHRVTDADEYAVPSRRCGLVSADDRERSPRAAGEEEPDYRFTLANERTFLAWIRTALALIAGGVAVVQFVPAFGIPGVRNGLSVVLTAGGGLLAALAVRRWNRVQAAMRRGADLPSTHVPLVLGGAVVVVTIAVLAALILGPSAGQ
jgi:putative membrane protein